MLANSRVPIDAVLIVTSICEINGIKNSGGNCDEQALKVTSESKCIQTQ